MLQLIYLGSCTQDFCKNLLLLEPTIYIDPCLPYPPPSYLWLWTQRFIENKLLSTICNYWGARGRGGSETVEWGRGWSLHSTFLLICYLFVAKGHKCFIFDVSNNVFAKYVHNNFCGPFSLQILLWALQLPYPLSASAQLPTPVRTSFVHDPVNLSLTSLAINNIILDIDQCFSNSSMKPDFSENYRCY